MSRDVPREVQKMQGDQTSEQWKREQLEVKFSSALKLMNYVARQLPKEKQTVSGEHISLLKERLNELSLETPTIQLFAGNRIAIHTFTVRHFLNLVLLRYEANPGGGGLTPLDINKASEFVNSITLIYSQELGIEQDPEEHAKATKLLNELALKHVEDAKNAGRFPSGD